MALSRMWLASEECEGPRLRPVPRSRAIRAPYVLRLSPVFCATSGARDRCGWWGRPFARGSTTVTSVSLV